MGERIEISQTELALILEALDDAGYYRDTRSRVLEISVRKATRRGVRTAPEPGAATDEHRLRARAYGELAAKLRGAAKPLKPEPR